MVPIVVMPPPSPPAWLQLHGVCAATGRLAGPSFIVPWLCNAWNPEQRVGSLVLFHLMASYSFQSSRKCEMAVLKFISSPWVAGGALPLFLPSHQLV